MGSAGVFCALVVVASCFHLSYTRSVAEEWHKACIPGASDADSLFVQKSLSKEHVLKKVLFELSNINREIDSLDIEEASNQYARTKFAAKHYDLLQVLWTKIDNYSPLDDAAHAHKKQDSQAPTSKENTIAAAEGHTSKCDHYNTFMDDLLKSFSEDRFDEFYDKAKESAKGLCEQIWHDKKLKVFDESILKRAALDGLALIKEEFSFTAQSQILPDDRLVIQKAVEKCEKETRETDHEAMKEIKSLEDEAKFRQECPNLLPKIGFAFPECHRQLRELRTSALVRMVESVVPSKKIAHDELNEILSRNITEDLRKYGKLAGKFEDQVCVDVEKARKKYKKTNVKTLLSGLAMAKLPALDIDPFAPLEKVVKNNPRIVSHEFQALLKYLFAFIEKVVDEFIGAKGSADGEITSLCEDFKATKMQEIAPVLEAVELHLFPLIAAAGGRVYLLNYDERVALEHNKHDESIRATAQKRLNSVMDITMERLRESVHGMKLPFDSIGIHSIDELVKTMRNNAEAAMKMQKYPVEDEQIWHKEVVPTRMSAHFTTSYIKQVNLGYCKHHYVSLDQVKQDLRIYATDVLIVSGNSIHFQHTLQRFHADEWHGRETREEMLKIHREIVHELQSAISEMHATIDRLAVATEGTSLAELCHDVQYRVYAETAKHVNRMIDVYLRNFVTVPLEQQAFSTYAFNGIVGFLLDEKKAIFWKRIHHAVALIAGSDSGLLAKLNGVVEEEKGVQNLESIYDLGIAGRIILERLKAVTKNGAVDAGKHDGHEGVSTGGKVAVVKGAIVKEALSQVSDEKADASVEKDEKEIEQKQEA